MYFWIAQSLGLLGLLCNTVSYQFRKRSHILFLQSAGSVFFATHFFMLGAISGGLLNVIGFFRASVSAVKDRWRIPTAILNGVFISLYVLSYISVFTVFGKEATLFNLILELLPVAAMIISTVGFSAGSAKAVRVFSSVASPFWLVYNGFNLSVGGVCSEVLCLTSAVLGFIRHDHMKKNCTDKQKEVQKL